MTYATSTEPDQTAHESLCSLLIESNYEIPNLNPPVAEFSSSLSCTSPFIITPSSSRYDLTLVLLNPIYHAFANSVDPDQLASEEAN